MRPFVVVAVDEVIEPRLLLQEVGRGGLGGFLLERYGEGVDLLGGR